MTIESPWVLLFLLPTIAMVGFAGWHLRQRREALRRYLDTEPKNRFWPTSPTLEGVSDSRGIRGAFTIHRSLDKTRNWAALTVAGGIGLVLALSGVTWGTQDVRLDARSSPIVLLVDISASMGVEDVPWGRLGAAKNFIRRFGAELGPVPIGLTVFSDEPHHLLPPTVDQDLLFTYLDALDPTMGTGRGTSIERVLADAAERASGPAAEGLPIFVLVSDGEDELDPAASQGVAESIGRAGGRLATIVTGTSGGGPVPPGLLPPDYQQSGPSPGSSASVPGVSSADQDRMRRLAEAAGGPSYSLSDPDGFQDFVSWFRDETTGTSEFETERRPVNRWPWFAGLALGSLLLGPVPGPGRPPTGGKKS